MSPGAFSRIVQRSAKAIRDGVHEAAGPTARVPTIVTGGLDAGMYSGYLEAMLSVAPNGLGVDAIGLHSYAVNPETAWPADWPDPRGWSNLVAVDRVLEQLDGVRSPDSVRVAERGAAGGDLSVSWASALDELERGTIHSAGGGGRRYPWVDSDPRFTSGK